MTDSQSTPDVGTDAFRDTLHEILANSERRTVLNYLLRHDRVSLDQLGAELAAAKYEAGYVTGEQQHRCLVGLAHVHLPKLHTAGLVTWDRDTKLVSSTTLLDQLKTTPGSFPDRWGQPDHGEQV